MRGQNNAIFSTILLKSNAKALQSYTNCGTWQDNYDSEFKEILWLTKNGVLNAPAQNAQ